jgi:hypothetical protein
MKPEGEGVTEIIIRVHEALAKCKPDFDNVNPL